MKVVNWKICPHCGAKKKNLPLHIKGVHEVTSTQEPVIEGIALPTEITKNQSLGFSFGEINMCQICREEYPSKIMEFHMHTRHGM